MQTTVDSCGLDRIEACAQGREESTRPTLDRIYLSLAVEVRIWIRARSGSSLRAVLDVDDVAQDVWLRVAQSYSRFDSQRGSFRAWVYRITQHTVFDLMRTLRSAPSSLDDPGAWIPEAPAVAPLSSTSRGARQDLPECFLAELATLSAADFELLRICGLEGRPTCEAARELALSDSTARKRWLRLRNRLARRTGLAARVE